MRLLSTIFLWSLISIAQGAELATARAERVSVSDERTVDGLVEAVDQATVSAQVAGRVQEIRFDVDDYVPQGAVILRFHDTEQRARVEVAQAALAEAQAREAQARSEFERIEKIYARKLVAKAALDRATAELKAAGARLKQAQARLKEADERLGNTVVRAPYAGIVTRRLVEVGELAGPGTPLMAGLSLDRLRVTAALGQSLLTRLDRDSPVRVLWDSGRSTEVGPTEVTVFPYIDPASHTARVRLQLPQGIEGLMPGMRVKAVFTVGMVERLLIPGRALVRRGELTAIYVIDGGIHLRSVRTGGRSADGRVEILAGLEVGEQVVLDPAAATVALKEAAAQ